MSNIAFNVRESLTLQHAGDSTQVILSQIFQGMSRASHVKAVIRIINNLYASRQTGTTKPSRLLLVNWIEPKLQIQL
jgi:hypothetical protein